MKTVEYVPSMMPTIIRRPKFFIDPLVSRNSESTAIMVAPEVMIVRPSVWVTLASSSVSRLDSRIRFRFSRTRSKMTIVSLME